METIQSCYLGKSTAKNIGRRPHFCNPPLPGIKECKTFKVAQLEVKWKLGPVSFFSSLKMLHALDSWRIAASLSNMRDFSSYSNEISPASCLAGELGSGHCWRTFWEGESCSFYVELRALWNPQWHGGMSVLLPSEESRKSRACARCFQGNKSTTARFQCFSKEDGRHIISPLPRLESTKLHLDHCRQ